MVSVCVVLCPGVPCSITTAGDTESEPWVANAGSAVRIEVIIMNLIMVIHPSVTVHFPGHRSRQRTCRGLDRDFDVERVDREGADRRVRIDDEWRGGEWPAVEAIRRSAVPRLEARHDGGRSRGGVAGAFDADSELAAQLRAARAPLMRH